MSDNVATTASKEVLARNVSRLMQMTKLNHSQLANLSELQRPIIYRVLAAEQEATLRTLDRIAAGFNRHLGGDFVTPQILLSEELQLPAEIFAGVT